MKKNTFAMCWRRADSFGETWKAVHGQVGEVEMLRRDIPRTNNMLG